MHVLPAMYIIAYYHSLLVIVLFSFLHVAVNGAVGPDITITNTTQPDDLTATSPPTKSPKRNRCFTCRKKVGLTGTV